MNAEDCDAKWRAEFQPLPWPESELKQVLAVREAISLGGRGRSAEWLSKERFGGAAPVEQVKEALRFLEALGIGLPVAPKPPKERNALPKGQADHNWELWRELKAVGQPMTAQELANRFKGITTSRVQETLEALCVMGMARVLVPFDEPRRYAAGLER